MKCMIGNLYLQDLTLIKSRQRCFMMNDYPDIPQKMEDWNKVNFNMVSLDTKKALTCVETQKR